MNDFDETITFEYEYTIVKKGDDEISFKNKSSESAKLWNTSSAGQKFLFINDGVIIIPINDTTSISVEEIEDKIIDWINDEGIDENNCRQQNEARAIQKKLKKLGCEFIKQKGSHNQFISPRSMGKGTVPMHTGEVPKGTFKSILKQANITRDEFNNIKSIKKKNKI